MKILGLLTVLLSLVLIGCEDRTDLTDPGTPNTGDADFTSFVTIGNSLTAGFQNNSLYESAQECSYGNLIAQQVDATYAQPLFDETGTAGKMSIVSLDPLEIAYSTESGNPLNLDYPAPYNNLGIPGALLYDVLNATDANTCASGLAGSPNELFDVVLRGLGTQFQQAQLLTPTFVTLWIGNNDILGYATSGGYYPYTSETDFEYLYGLLADNIATLNADVVVANIPSVTAIPFFTTIPPMLPDSLGNYTIPVYGDTGDGVRMLIFGKDLLTLSASGMLALGYGTEGNPLPTTVVLDSLEVATVANVTTFYNATISDLASANGFTLVDIYSFFNDIAANGYSVDGLDFTTAYIEGGLFSLDGVHPTSRGYGVVANKFIETINAEFDADIPYIYIPAIPGSIPFAGGV